MALPHIRTAIPQRRYQYGEFQLVVLSDIDSDDDCQYRYLLGVIPDKTVQPQLFISAEHIGNNEYQMRVIAEQVSQTVPHTKSTWGDLEDFVEDALKLTSELLTLEDEQPYRLL